MKNKETQNIKNNKKIEIFIFEFIRYALFKTEKKTEKSTKKKIIFLICENTFKLTLSILLKPSCPFMVLNCSRLLPSLMASGCIRLLLTRKIIKKFLKKRALNKKNSGKIPEVLRGDGEGLHGVFIVDKS